MTAVCNFVSGGEKKREKRQKNKRQQLLITCFEKKGAKFLSHNAFLFHPGISMGTYELLGIPEYSLVLRIFAYSDPTRAFNRLKCGEN